jgi:hypothetical protein
MNRSVSYLRGAPLLALAVFFAMSLASTANAQNTVGTISQMTGVVNVQRRGASMAGVVHMPIQLHDRISTESGGSVTIALVDQSTLQLGSNGVLVIDESVMVNGVGAPSKVGLLGGKLHTLIVGAMRGNSPAFEVHTPNAIGAVRGTEWDTAYTDGTTRSDNPNCTQFTDVDVQDGTVHVSNAINPNAGSEDIHAGHHTTVACAGAPLGEGAAGGAGGIGSAAGWTALGVGVVAGGTVGGVAAAGGFNGGGGSPPGCKNGKPGPPCGPKSPKE